MKTNEVSAKTNSRLDRIQTISRTLKVLFLFYLIGVAWFELPWEAIVNWWPQASYSRISDTPLLTLVELCVSAGLAVMLAITFWQLLNLYETGKVFSPRSVQLLGRFGCLAFGFGLARALVTAINWGWREWWETCSYAVFWKFFLFVILELLSSPWIIAGVLVFMISRIMDEGRKIQEEQELTV
jgi:hypothetical protein